MRLILTLILALLCWAPPVAADSATQPGSITLWQKPVSAQQVRYVLRKLPQAYVERGTEDPPDRMRRLEPLVEMLAGKPRWVVAGLITAAYHESRLARYVWFSCKEMPPGAGGNCSGGRALGVFQLEVSNCPKAWSLPNGSREQLAESVVCAERSVRNGLEACGARHPDGEVAGMFAGYRSQVKCHWRGRIINGTGAREVTFFKVLWWLNA